MAGNIKLSSSVPAVELGPAEQRESSQIFARRKGLLATLEWSVVGTLAIFIIFGFGLRVSKLGAIGFAEDEMNKLDAVRAYQHRDISANAEHPMLLKALMFLSLTSAGRGGGPDMLSDEFALRLPNAIFGALTVIPLFLLTAAFFDRWTGLLAAGFWAVGINAIAMNRVGKEDTLLVFFLLFAFYFYLRAKQTPPRNEKGKRRNYILSAASFGLMLASKYFPHYFGLNALFHHHVHVRKSEPGEKGGTTPKIFFALIIVVFLIANPAVLLPQVWEYLNAYMGGQLLTHTGYLFGDHLYKNNMSSTPFWGTPLYFYVLFMAIKIPLLVLAAFAVGFFISLKRWRHPGHAFLLFMFLFWIVPYSLIGAKWLRYSLSLMPFIYMLAAVGVVTLVGFLSSVFKNHKQAPVVISGAAIVIFMIVPAWTAYANNPHYALYTNALGADKAGYYFPHDEFYDDGLREAIKFVSDTAPQGAVIAHETPAVTRYYLERFSRTDLKSQAMSAPDFDPASLTRPIYVIIQRGRTYFENRDKLVFIRANFSKAHEVSINGLTAAEVFIRPKEALPPGK
ncbi:MAG: glycosyltransferase family 39 protein [Acidobacteriota bacterium]